MNPGFECYYVAESTSLEDLQAEVNNMIQNMDWQPAGGLTIVYDPENPAHGEKVFYQALCCPVIPREGA